MGKEREGHAGHDSRQDRGGHGAHAGRSAGHDKHAGHSVEMFRKRFWLSLAMTVPAVIWSEHPQMILGYEAPEFVGSWLIAPLFGTAVFLYGGTVFLRGAVSELGSRLPGMMTLISLAIMVAFVWSVAVLLGVPGEGLWWELATLVTIMLLGHWIEMRSVGQARGALKELAKLLPDTAVRVRGDTLEEVPVTELSENDVVLVRPGGAVPADGKVVEGKSSLNEAMISGESRPVKKSEGEEVIAGTVNGEGSLRVRVTGIGDKTTLAGMMRLVEDAQASRSGVQDLADRAAFLLTVVALGAGSMTLIVWLLIIGAETAFSIARVVTVLVIACPHALGLAVPLVVAISTTIGAKGGLLVRRRRGLEEARKLDLVVFDKTGTLTMGEFRVVSIRTAPGVERDEALRLAAAAERESEHPVARGIVRSAEDKGVDIPRATDFEALSGRGIRATVEGRKLLLGGPALLRGIDAIVPENIGEATDEVARRGQAAIFLLQDESVMALFAVADAIRPESREAVERLHQAGIEVAMLTGDSKAVAGAVAEDLGIDIFFAEVLPEEKVRKIESLKRQGKRVAMVGDGVNDAPALVTADVGVAIGAGTDVAVEAGDVVLVRSDPRDVARIVTLSHATYRKMLQNLWWAAGYNIVAIPLAAGVLAAWGVILQPAVGAILMSASTVIVAINAQLLRRIEV